MLLPVWHRLSSLGYYVFTAAIALAVYITLSQPYFLAAASVLSRTFPIKIFEGLK